VNELMLIFTLAALAHAPRRPPQPPSLPPSGAARLPKATGLLHSPLIQYEYKWSEGFIGSGDDAEPPKMTTVENALKHCDEMPSCRSITYAGSKDTPDEMKIYFKMNDDVALGAKGWSTWVKTANITSPVATIPVGGSSNLELLLRETFYTVQNLTRVGELWSFTRPLDDASVLPMSAHLGDLTLRLAVPQPHTSPLFTTIQLGAAAKPLSLDNLTPAMAGGKVLAAQDITDLLAYSNQAVPLPVRVVRSYELAADGASLVLRFNLTCALGMACALGGLGMALPESDGHPPAGLESVVWNDPHIGAGHGFVEFVRVVKDEATLLVTALDPHTSPLEAWRPMLEDLGNGDAYEWVVASKAWTYEWAGNRQYPFLNVSDALAQEYPPFATSPTPWPATDGKVGMPVLASPGQGASDPWNAPTTISIAPGETYTIGLKLRLAPGDPRTRDETLEAMGCAVLHGVPGFVLSSDLNSARLFIKPPKGASVTGVTGVNNPAVEASLQFSKQQNDEGEEHVQAARAHASGFESYAVTASGYGRVRVNINFSDSTSMTAHYYVLPPLAQQVRALGSHFANTAWLPRGFIDPFGRSASVMPWDRSACDAHGTPCGHVLNDARAYDVGLSDDAGGGNPLGLASKVRAMPNAHEVSRIDDYIEFTLYGVKPDTAKPPLKSLQIREEEVGLDIDGVRMTMFYYDKDLNNYSSGHFNWSYTEADKCNMPFGGPTWCMTEDMSNATYRGFNYPHQIASYWAMYTVARFTTLRTRKPWHWYLYRAGKTCLKLGEASVGFMDGTVAREVLEAMLVEAEAGNTTFADIGSKLTDQMWARQKQWERTPYPYGSEFGFDTTGQEEVVVWNLYFGNETVAKKTVDHILSYMRSSPTWAYHGGSRSWGDIGNNGKYLATFGTGAADRGTMHYRSGLNMIPLLEWYRLHPEEGRLLLEISMGAISGQMTNIDPTTGATSMMFHVTPHMLAFDPHSGDYGLGFFGNALESGAYFVDDAELGPLCYLCDLDTLGSAPDGTATPVLVPRDAYRIAVFLEPIGLYLTAECGTISAVTVTFAPEVPITVTFAAGAPCASLRLKLRKTAKARPGSNFAVEFAPLVRGAYEIKPAQAGKETKVTLSYDY
jgi:hypothetical protein